MPGTYEAETKRSSAGSSDTAVWNARSNRPPNWGIRDFDVFYFDDSDLSWDAEYSVIESSRKLFGDVEMNLQVRNQARVHLLV